MDGTAKLVKTCSYCGRENEDVHASCGECGTFFAPLDSAKVPAAPNKAFVWVRRGISALLGLLLLALAAPEFGYMPPKWIFFWVVTPIVPVVCVWYGAGRKPMAEMVGWVLLLLGVVLFFGG